MAHFQIVKIPHAIALHGRQGIEIRDTNGEIHFIASNVSWGGSAIKLAWSPNSQNILFVGYNQEHGIYVVPRIADKNYSPQLLLEASVSAFSLSSDGTKLAYMTVDFGNNEFHIINVENWNLND